MIENIETSKRHQHNKKQTTTSTPPCCRHSYKLRNLIAPILTSDLRIAYFSPNCLLELASYLNTHEHTRASIRHK